MKKITAFFALLMLVCMGAKADVVTTWTTAGSIVTKDALVASAGTGARYAFRMPSNSQPGWCGFNSTTGKVDILDVDHLFTIENGTGDAEGKFWLKRYSNGEYLTGNNEFSATPTIGLTLTARPPENVTDYDTGYSDSTPFVSFDNDEGKHYNNGNSNYDFRGGTGGWSVYVTYGPFYIVTVDCQEGGTSMEGYPQTLIVTENTTIEAPEFVGKAVQGTDSYTISEDQNITFNYQAASTFDYTLVVNGAPEGTTIKIKDETVSAGAVSFDSQVTQSDVVVTFPTEFEYYVFTVTVDGTTITINCEDPRWPVNFPKTQTFTRGDRHINSVDFNGQTVDGLYVDQSTLCYQDLTATKTVTLPVNTTVKPSFNVAGNWQHGFVYIDLNNDGDFTDEGELVAKSPTTGSPNLATQIAEFTSPATEGTYRMRVKTDWASEDPGGNTDPGNYIINNGGQIVDLTLVVVGGADVTFVVKAENGDVLFSETTTVAIGETVTTLPETYQRPLFYTYSTVNETISGNTTLTFTATPKADAPFQFTADTSAPVWYFLKLKGANYPTYEADSEPNVTLPTTNAEDETTSWAFIGNPYSGFQIVNKAAGTNLILGSESATGNGGDTYATLATAGTQTHEVWTIEASSYATNGFFIRNADGHALNQRNVANLAYWTGGADNGSTFVATKVPENTITYIEALENLSNDKVYTVHNTPRAMWMFTETALAADPLANVDIYAEAANPAAKHQIAIVKQNNKYYLYSVEQGKYLAAGNKLYQSPLEAVEIIESTVKSGKYMWFFRFEGYTDKNINTNGTPAIEINWWNTHDYGNTNAIMETDATYSVDDALAAFTDYTQCITDYCDYKGITTDFTNHLGEMGYPKAGTTATTAFTEILNRNASSENTAEDWNTLVEKYNAVWASDNVKMPEVGNFYRIKGVAGGRYMQSTVSTTAADGKVGTRLGATADADASTIFYLDTNNKLLGFSNGMYVTNTCDFNSNVANNSTGATQFTFVPRKVDGTFAVKNGDTFLYSWDGETNYCVDRQGSDHANCVLTIEEVKELPVTLHESETKEGYSVWIATFSAPVSVVSVEGAEIHKVSDTGSAFFCEPANVQGIPAGKGALLVTDTETATATVTLGETSEDFETILQPLYACEKGKAGLFFGKVEGSQIAGLYPIDSETPTGGFKAFVDDSTGEGKELVFDQDPTGIENMEHGTLNMNNGAIFNLQGQRVNKAQKGVFIQNGRKVVLK